MYFKIKRANIPVLGIPDPLHPPQKKKTVIIIVEKISSCFPETLTQIGQISFSH